MATQPLLLDVDDGAMVHERLGTALGLFLVVFVWRELTEMFSMTLLWAVFLDYLLRQARDLRIRTLG